MAQKKFRVSIPEVHISVREVMANSIEEAVALAGEADEVTLEYDRTLEDGWECEDVTNQTAFSFRG